MAKEIVGSVTEQTLALTPEKLEQDIPTRLSLFTINPTQQQELNQKLLVAREFKNQFHQASTALYAFFGATDERDDRLIAKHTELRGDLLHLKCANAASLAYLAIHQELSKLGVSDKDTFDFYSRCLELNNRASSKLYPATDPETVFRNVNTFKRATSIMNDFQDQARNHPKPNWFKGDREKWLSFFIGQAYFRRLLNPDDYSQNYIVGLSNGLYDVTYPQFVPDWLIRARSTKQLPDIEGIKHELAEDQLEESRARAYCQDIEKQRDTLDEIQTEKEYRANLWAQKAMRQTFNYQPIRSLPELAIYLNAVQKVFVFPVDISTVVDHNLDRYRPTNPDKNRESTIQDYLNQTYLTRESVALWLEKSLKSTCASIDSPQSAGNFLQVIKCAVNLIECRDRRESYQEYAQELDPKTVRFIKNELSTLISGLPSADRVELIELAEIESRNTRSAETLYWLVADYVVANKDNIRRNDQKNNADRVAGDIRKYAFNWLKNNWTWLYDNLDQALHSPAVGTIYFNEPEQVIVADDSEDFEKELEREGAELSKGSLAGWTIQYNTNRHSSDPKYLVCVEGETLKEQEEFIKKFFNDEGITCTIKPRSLVNLLEDVAELPEEVEQTWMSEEWGDVRYKKRKRDDMRILYIRDLINKSLLFTTYHKNEVV